MAGDNRALPQEKPKLSGMALASMILGIVSIPLVCAMGLGALLGIVAVILGSIALFAIGKNPRRYGGKGFAIAGIATGGAGILWAPLALALLLPSLGQARSKARSVACLSNLKSLSLAAYMYQNDFSGYYPAPGGTPPADNDWIYWQPGRDPTKGMLAPYMGKVFTSKPYTCPSDTTVGTRAAGIYQYSYTANVNVFVNPGATAPGIPNTPLRFSSIHSPGTKIVLVEEDSASIDDAAWEPQNWKPGMIHNSLSTRHDKTGNYVNCADGHAEPVLRSDAMTPHYYDPLAP